MATAPVSDRAFAEFERLADRGLNFAPISFDRATSDPDWHVDRRQVDLPKEAPGPPVDDGPFEIARRLMVGYAFADPAKIRAIYDPGSDLHGRDMLLVGRFVGMRLHMGVRIGGVVEGQVAIGGEVAHRFGWHYRTLEEHLERGQMDYELLKWTETGAVEFRIRAYSQRAEIESWIVRTGFALFGRTVQLRFYDRSLARMRRLVSQRTTS